MNQSIDSTRGGEFAHEHPNLQSPPKTNNIDSTLGTPQIPSLLLGKQSLMHAQSATTQSN